MLTSRIRIIKMGLFIAQAFLFLSVFLSVYGTFTNWKKPAPVTAYKLQPIVHEPIYNEKGKVISGDFYRGDLKYVYAGVSKADYSFVYYYAPWDRESQDFANDFWRLAHKYSSVAYFAAVNCWYNKGECKHTFPRTTKFPQIISYVRGYHGNTYHGPLKVDAVEEFIVLYMKPVQVLHSISDLMGLTADHQAVIIGHYNVSDFTNTYFDRYLSAVRKAAYPSRENNWVFTVVLSVDVAKEFSLQYNDIVLVMWNSTSYFSHNGNYTSDNILQWVKTDFSRVAVSYQRAFTDNGLIEQVMESSIGVFIISPKVATSEPHFPQGVSLDAHQVELKDQTFEMGECGLNQNLTEGLCKRRNILSVLRTSDVMMSIRTQTDSNVAVKETFNRKNMAAQSNIMQPYWQQLSLMYAEMPFSSLKIHNQSVFFIFADRDFVFPSNCVVPLNDSRVNAVIVDNKNEAVSIVENFEPTDLVSLFRNCTLVGAACSSKSSMHSAVAFSNPDILPVYDVVSSEFENLVINNEEDVLLFYTSVACGLCVGVSHVIISLAHMVRLVSKIRIYQIDGSSTSLPWQYSVPSYPTLVLYPGQNKADSVMFPLDEPMTVQNVITFLANNISPESRLELSLLYCNEESSHCIRDAKVKLRLRIQQLRLQLAKLDEELQANATDFRNSVVVLNRNVISNEINYLNLMNFGLWTKVSSFAAAL